MSSLVLLSLDNLLTIVFGIASIIVALIGLPFLLNWIRKPNLRVDALPNDPDVGIKPLLQRVKEDESSTVKSQTAEHKSQHYIATWTEKGESPDVLTEKPRLSIKFGVLKVSNQPRSIKARRFHAGNATNLKADIRLKPMATRLQDGRFSEFPKEQQIWSIPMPLSWYHEGWDIPIRAMGVGVGEAQQNQIKEWKRFRDNPLYLLEKYLRNETIDMLPAGREAYLLLFMTSANSPNSFIPIWGYESRFLGKYRFKISLFSSETSLFDLLYECEIRGWNDFTVTPLKEDS